MRLVLQVAPVRVLTDDAGKVHGIEMIRMELGEPDASGRRRPVPLEGSEFVVECDQVISAIGQYPKLDGAGEAEGLAHTRWRTLAVDDWTLQTADPKVFAGGDAVLGAQTVIQAIAQGKKAAWSIDRLPARRRHAGRLEAAARPAPHAVPRGAGGQGRHRAGRPPHGRGAAGVHRHQHRHRRDVSAPAHMPKLWPEDRKTNFAQIELGFPEDEAVRGARALPAVHVRGARRVRAAASGHRVRGVRQPLPGHRGARLRGLRRPAPHRLRPQALHPLRQVRRRVPRRAGHRGHRLHAARLRRQGRRRRSTTPSTRRSAASAASASTCAPPARSPTGSSRAAKPWDRKKVRTTCPFCGVGCNFDLNVAHGKVVGVTAAYDAPVNQGSLCVKGRFHTDLIDSPERITHPLIKRDGDLGAGHVGRGARPRRRAPAGASRPSTAPTPSGCSARPAAPTKRTTSCRGSRGRVSTRTTSTTAPVPDTLPRWPVWPPRWVQAR